MNATDFKAALAKEISEDNLPQRLGGKFSLYNEPYEFDLTSTSPFYKAPPKTFEDIISEQKDMVGDENEESESSVVDEHDTWRDSIHEVVEGIEAPHDGEEVAFFQGEGQTQEPKESEVLAVQQQNVE
jgi:hypothetical protein